MRKGGDTTWSIRFTPRKAKSIWSAINIKRIAELKAAGRMHAAGLAAYEGRDPRQQKKYSFENQRRETFAGLREEISRQQEGMGEFRKDAAVVRHPAIWWVVSAKQEATRERRLDDIDRRLGGRPKAEAPDARPARRR